MKTNLLLASLIAASFTTADAEPTAAPAPPPATRLRQSCEPTGVPLFEIDHRGVDTTDLVLYPSGGWTFMSRDKTVSGCLRYQVLQAIERDLKQATWTVETNAAKCMIASLGYVQYSSRGKVVWTQRGCQLEYLDETSRRSLDEIEKILVSQVRTK